MDRRNYLREMETLLQSLEGTRPQLLLHSCCGPCSSSVIDDLRHYFELTVFFYNPQIFPEDEYERRREAQKILARAYGIPVVEGDRDEREFLHRTADVKEEPEGGKRCSRCFYMRLEETARRAKEKGFPYIASTLSVSPHKDAKRLNAIGERVAHKHGVIWLPSDFKKRDGYRKSVELAKAYGLYRQDYCGCRYSRREEK